MERNKEIDSQEEIHFELLRQINEPISSPEQSLYSSDNQTRHRDSLVNNLNFQEYSIGQQNRREAMEFFGLHGTEIVDKTANIAKKNLVEDHNDRDTELLKIADEFAYHTTSAHFRSYLSKIILDNGNFTIENIWWYCSKYSNCSVILEFISILLQGMFVMCFQMMVECLIDQERDDGLITYYIAGFAVCYFIRTLLRNQSRALRAKLKIFVLNIVKVRKSKKIAGWFEILIFWFLTLHFGW